RAKEIYLSLQANGWDATLAKFKPKAGSAGKTAATIGEFVEEVKEAASARPKTIESYFQALRTIVADICGIDGGKSKYDYRPRRPGFVAQEGSRGENRGDHASGSSE